MGKKGNGLNCAECADGSHAESDESMLCARDGEETHY